MKYTGTRRPYLSYFLGVFERDGLVALFHQLHPEPIYLSKKNWHGIITNVTDGVQLDHSIMPELIIRKLLIDGPDSDRHALEIARERALHLLNRPTILYLMMAQGCNFACGYCPIPALAKQYGECLLPFKDATEGIALWQKHIDEYPHDGDPYFLIFYGGEPLLNRKILEQLLPYIAKGQATGKFSKKIKLMLCTNGSLIDERLSRLLAHYKVIVAVGVDGPQEYNDHIRIMSNGDPTFAVIRYAIKQLVDNGVYVVASVTITPANMYRLAEYHDFLRGLGIAQFGFNLMKGVALTRELAGGSVEDYCRVAAQAVLFGLGSKAENGQCYEYQLEKKLVALQKGIPFSIDCTCYGNQLVIQADGQVSNCPFLRLDQGHIGKLPETFRIGHTETVRIWRHRLPLLNNLIFTDGINGLLDGGGCAWSSSELCGDAVARDTSNTIFVKEIMHELIWTLLPKQHANALRRGEITYWSYRRIGSLRTSRTGNF